MELIPIPKKLFDADNLFGDWAYPILMWRGTQKFDHAKHSEMRLIDIVLPHIRGTFVEQSQGYDPEYDCIIRLFDGRQALIEIKISEKEEMWIEVGRGDGTTSGLSASKADFYLMVSRHPIDHPDGTTTYVGKVRMCSTLVLQRESLLAQKNRTERKWEANDHGPSSISFPLDPWHDQVIYLGDVECVVEDKITRYNLSKFIATYGDPNRSIGDIDRAMDAIERATEKPQEIA